MRSLNAIYGKRNQSPLSNDELRLVAPSVFANEAAARTSERYNFIPTIDVVESLKKEGWLPVWATEQSIRKESREGFQKHMLRLRHQSADLECFKNVGDSCVELVLTNAHDGTAAYSLHAGVFRKVCSNGLIVADETFAAMKVRHDSKNEVDGVIEASYRVLDEVPEIQGSIDEMLSVPLKDDERMALANSALCLRWDKEEDTPIRAEQLLRPRRYGDREKDLYTTFNVIQENLIRGGVRGRNKKNNRTTTRAVKSINENVKLNKALWTLSQEMKKLKVAA